MNTILVKTALFLSTIIFGQKIMVLKNKAVLTRIVFIV